MSPPTSELFEVQEIPNAGRGVIATQRIPAGTVVLDTHPPAAHVILRQYRKEVCASCFKYDRGRTLPIRDNDVGKVFCSPECQVEWRDYERSVGVDAWRALQKYVQSKSKSVVIAASLEPAEIRPDVEQINSAWRMAEDQIQQSFFVPGAKKRPPKSNTQAVDPDILGVFLSAVLYHHHHPDRWPDVLSLAMHDQPYYSEKDLEIHVGSFLQLAGIIPSELLPSLNANVCRTVVHAGSHNAFGIRSGSEDGEEYMGYSIYPIASYFNHSCRPNIFKKRVGARWQFTAGKDVDEGEQCCITYLGGDEEYLTLAERRARLMEVWGFKCTCNRCLEEESKP